MKREVIINKLKVVLKDTEILMNELEAERDENLKNSRFEGDEELVSQHYKKILTSIYRMRNNTAALLLRNRCMCKVDDENVYITLDDYTYKLSKSAIKNVLQKDYDDILTKNIIVEKEEEPIIEEKEAEPENIIFEMKGFDPEKTNNIEQENKDKKEEATEADFFNFEFKIPDYLNKNETADVSESESEEKDEPQKEADDLDFNLNTEFEFDSKPIEKENIEKDKIQEIKNKENIELDINLSFDLSEPGYDEQNDAEEIKTEKEVEIDMSIFDEVLENEPEKKDVDEKSFDTTDFNLDDPFEQNNKKDDDLSMDMSFDLSPDKEEDSVMEFDMGNASDGKVFEDEPEEKEEYKPGMDFFIGGSAEAHNPGMLGKKEETIRDSMEFDLERRGEATDAAASNKSDTMSMLERLKSMRSTYDKNQMEEKIKKEIEKNETKEENGFFDLSTGKMKEGTVDVKEATGKIGKIADGVIHTSMGDKLKNMRLEQESDTKRDTYRIQTNSDYERTFNNMVLDFYKIKVSVLNESGKITKEEMATLTVAPMTIPESGSKMVTDICACLKDSKDTKGTVVLPEGKTTLTLKNDDYTVIIRGSWENGDFKSNISVIGRGVQIKHQMAKKEIRPKSMEGIGIGHNVLYLDHATTVHIIPVTFNNSLFGFTELMLVVCKDYGIDRDAECIITKGKPDISVKGEKYNYTMSGKWDNERKLIIDFKIDR